MPKLPRKGRPMKIRAWAIECDDGEGGRMLVVSNGIPDMFFTRAECRKSIMSIKEFYADNDMSDDDGHPRPVRILIEKEEKR